MQRWNAQIGNVLGARIDLVRWETHSAPDLSCAPQAVLNEQIVAGCDIGMALFWSRFGTPTSEYESGSLEEIHRLLDQGARMRQSSATAGLVRPAVIDFRPFPSGDRYAVIDELVAAACSA